MKTAARIAVIIPFYQSEPGILARALDSIRAQVLPPGVRLQVIVVDDASPVPAMAEMAGYDDDDRITWRSIRQDNAGPGGARNTGLGYAAAIGNALFDALGVRLREGLPTDRLEPQGRRAVAGLVADGLVDGRVVLTRRRLVLTRRGRLLTDTAVRALLAGGAHGG